MIDFVNRWATRAELQRQQFVAWLGVASSTFYSWCGRYGKVNEHNHLVPRDHWLEDHEKLAILDYERRYPLEGYRRLAFMMLCSTPDGIEESNTPADDLVAASDRMCSTPDGIEESNTMPLPWCGRSVLNVLNA